MVPNERTTRNCVVFVLAKILVSEIPSTNFLHLSCLTFLDRELPRVLAIYDIDLPLKDARSAIRGHFADNAHLRDDRVIDMVLEKGYMELEETLLQHKQRSHLLRTFEGYVLLDGASRKRLQLDSTIAEQFARN
jgi:hypothetical protein